MESYVCILLAPDGRIVTVETFTAASDGAAFARVERLAQGDGIASYQLWHKGRRIAADMAEPLKN